MEPLELGNSSEPGPEIVKRQRVAKERAAQSWTVQNEIRGVLGRVYAGRALDSANPREIRT